MTEDRSTDEPEWMRLAWQLAGDIRQRRRAAGLSQPRLAARIGYTKQYVSLAERPQRGLPSASLVQAIDDALDADGALVTLHEQADTARKACRSGTQSSTMAEDNTVETATTTADTTTTDATTGGGPGQQPDRAEVGKARRRKVVALAAAIAFGDRLDEPVRQILAAADEPQVPTRVRGGDIQHLRTALEELKTWDSKAGGGAVRHRAVAALRWATALLGASCTPTIRKELTELTAQLADSAAWATFDAGQYEQARQLSLLGLQTARESGNLGIRANVASGLARQEVYGGNWAGGLELIQLAFTANSALTPNEIADLHTVNALAYARKPDTRECFHCINAAIDTYLPESIANDPPWLSYFIPAQFERDLAFARYDLLRGEADIGERAAHRLALIECFSAAFQRYPVDRVRCKAIIAARLATLLYREGERNLAHQRVEDAITLAGQVRSARLADDLRVLLRAVPPIDRTDEYTRDLRQRLSAMLTDMA